VGHRSHPAPPARCRRRRGEAPPRFKCVLQYPVLASPSTVNYSCAQYVGCCGSTTLRPAEAPGFQLSKTAHLGWDKRPGGLEAAASATGPRESARARASVPPRRWPRAAPPDGRCPAVDAILGTQPIGGWCVSARRPAAHRVHTHGAPRVRRDVPNAAASFRRDPGGLWLQNPCHAVRGRWPPAPRPARAWPSAWRAARTSARLGARLPVQPVPDARRCRLGVRVGGWWHTSGGDPRRGTSPRSVPTDSALGAGRAPVRHVARVRLGRCRGKEEASLGVLDSRTQAHPLAAAAVNRCAGGPGRSDSVPARCAVTRPLTGAAVAPDVGPAAAGGARRHCCRWGERRSRDRIVAAMKFRLDCQLPFPADLFWSVRWGRVTCRRRGPGCLDRGGQSATAGVHVLAARSVADLSMCLACCVSGRPSPSLPHASCSLVPPHLPSTLCRCGPRPALPNLLSATASSKP